LLQLGTVHQLAYWHCLADGSAAATDADLSLEKNIAE
jgi:hypothetical protein